MVVQPHVKVEAGGSSDAHCNTENKKRTTVNMAIEPDLFFISNCLVWT